MFGKKKIILVAAVQQRMSSHGHYEDIGPKASYNQLPQPEGDWKTKHDEKQTKYNAILLGSALFFAGTFVFVSLFIELENCFWQLSKSECSF